MKLSNGEIFKAREPLSKLMETKFPIKVAYELAKLRAALEPQLAVVEEVRRDLVQTYGEADPENPQRRTVNPQSEGFPKFAEDFGILMAQEVEIELTVVELPDTLEIEPSTLMALDKFIRLGTN